MSKLVPTRTYSNHTATEVLRRLLDERGVKWEDASPVPSMKPWKTSFTSFTGEEVSIGAYDEPKWLMGTMVFHTPEQAIAATLGAGTCKVDVRNGDWYCDACGEMVGTCDPASELFIDGNAIDMWKYCPFCGRRIEQ